MQHEGRAVPVRGVERYPNRRFNLDARVLLRPADVIGAELAAKRDVDRTIHRADGPDVGGRHGRGQPILLGAEDHDEPADRKRKDQHQDGSGQLFGPAFHPPE